MSETHDLPPANALRWEDYENTPEDNEWMNAPMGSPPPETITLPRQEAERILEALKLGLGVSDDERSVQPIRDAITTLQAALGNRNG